MGPAPIIDASLDVAPGRAALAKGQKRSGREPKKPKADKKKLGPAGSTVASTLAKPKPGEAAQTKK
jgi:hypothetical protein